MGKSKRAGRLAEATVKAWQEWRKMFGKQQQESTGRIVRVKSDGVPLVQLIGRGKRINPHQMPIELSVGYRMDIPEISCSVALVVDKVTLDDFIASDHPAAEAHRQRDVMFQLREALDKRLMSIRTGRGWLFYRRERVIDSGMGQLRHVKQLVTPATHVPANKRPRGKAYRKALDREVAAGWYASQPRHGESL